jgi:4-hydroxy-4-methyl-2-oxoglutarate aldolase
VAEGTEWRAIADELMAAGVSTVYEAAGRRGGMKPGLQPFTDGQRLFGRALTARCQPGDNLAVHRVVAEAQTGDVLVVDGACVLVGYWGEILTAAAQVRGVAGTPRQNMLALPQSRY